MNILNYLSSKFTRDCIKNGGTKISDTEYSFIIDGKKRFGDLRITNPKTTTISTNSVGKKANYKLTIKGVPFITIFGPILTRMYQSGSLDSRADITNSCISIDGKHDINHIDEIIQKCKEEIDLLYNDVITSIGVEISKMDEFKERKKKQEEEDKIKAKKLEEDKLSNKECLKYIQDNKDNILDILIDFENDLKSTVNFDMYHMLVHFAYRNTTEVSRKNHLPMDDKTTSILRNIVTAKNRFEKFFPDLVISFELTQNSIEFMIKHSNEKRINSLPWRKPPRS